MNSRVALACAALVAACDSHAVANPIPSDVTDVTDDASALHPSDARSIPKWVTPLPIPPVFVPKIVIGDGGKVVAHEYAVDVRETTQQVLPLGYPRTKVWAYGAPAKSLGGVVDASFRAFPSATFEATRGTPVRVTWTNALTDATHLFAVDPTVHWADPNALGMQMPPFVAYPPGYPSAQSGIALVTHLHGGEVASASDGFPTAFVTADGRHGPSYGSTVDGQTNAATFRYPNEQAPATLWYHDHALGLTRLNVQAGLAGFYLLRDPTDAVAAALPSGTQEIPLLLQDRSFDDDGSLAFGAVGTNPEAHPYWNEFFFGDVIVVNGVTWPNLDVEPRRYRLRLVDGSNGRFYHLRLVDAAANLVAFTQIGTDGGYLPKPVALTDLLLSPGERADVLVDFSGHAGRTLRFVNDAPAPFPGGEPPDPETTGQILQFTVASTTPTPPTPIPTSLTTIVPLTPDAPPRVVTLLERMGTNGALISLLNGQSWEAPVSETPRVGSTEDWQIVNLSEHMHPIHLHLVQFQIVGRQPLDGDRYLADWLALNGNPTLPIETAQKSLDPTSYLTEVLEAPRANEHGWKDTLVAQTGKVTTIRVRFAPTNAPTSGTGAASPGVNLFGFDPTMGPGYVWHCHILDHEDNEMMRPMTIGP